jgi:cytochrome c556
MSRKLTIGGLIGVGALVLVLSVAAQEAAKESERTSSAWMKQKLANSERILEGLTRGDLDLVNKHASAMRLLNKIEYFVRREPPAYRTQLHQFQFSVEELVRTSQDGNLDGATLAFTQMTISCVNCHKQLRKT